MNIRPLLLGLTAAALFAGPAALAPQALAADAPAAPPARYVSPSGKTLHILTEAQVDPARLLPPPVRDGSEEQKAELADVQKAYRNRTPERRAVAEWDDKHETVELFFKTLGPEFDLKKLPRTAKLIAALENEQSVAANIAKKHFQRNRPWAVDPSLVACDYKPNAAPLTSYPSGHATLSYSEGYILAELMPEKAEPILSRAREYAYSRLVCGAHYASDIEASHVLGTELAMMLMDNPAFAADFKASQAELRSAGLTR
jgi:acid phosphatase (class A)